MRRKLLSVLLTLAAGLGLLAGPACAADDSWGTVKGQVIFGGDTIPETKPIDVSNTWAICCLSAGISGSRTRVSIDSRGLKMICVFGLSSSSCNVK